jgi:hypothetical protein
MGQVQQGAATGGQDGVGGAQEVGRGVGQGAVQVEDQGWVGLEGEQGATSRNNGLRARIAAIYERGRQKAWDVFAGRMRDI